MAAVTRTALAATLLATAACYSPRETRGADEALAIYRRSGRPEAPPHAPERTNVADRAPAPGAADAPLTVERAITLAKKSSAQLSELGARLAAAEAAIDAAGQRNNPELRAVNVRVARAIDRGEDLRVAPRLRFSPERPGEIASREAEARAGANAVRAEIRAEEQAIEAEVRWLFDDAVLLEAEIGAEEQAAESRRKFAMQTREQVATATATAVDASLADLYAVEAAARLSERRSRHALVLAALSDRIGTPSGTKLELTGDASAWPPPALPSEQELVEAALRASPGIAGSAARIDGASARVHLEQGKRWPWFRFVEIGYEFDRSSTNVPLWTVGAGVELPIFSANGGAIRHAEANENAAKMRLQTEVDRIVRDVRARLRDTNAAAALVSEFRVSALPAVERAKDDAARALASGSIDTLRALAVDERRGNVELELLKLVRRYRTAVDGLRRAVGGPLPTPARR